jgi:hypothetical protein
LLVVISGVLVVVCWALLCAACGAEIKVPLFINKGDVVKIDTSSGNYLERIKK